MDQSQVKQNEEIERGKIIALNILCLYFSLRPSTASIHTLSEPAAGCHMTDTGANTNSLLLLDLLS